MYTVYAIKRHDKVLYVGKTINFKRRMYEHRYRKKLDKTHQFLILEENLPQADAKIKEEFYISKYDTFENGWNRTAGEGTRNVKSKQGDGRFTKGNDAVKYRKIKKVFCVETGETYNTVKECASLRLHLPAPMRRMPLLRIFAVSAALIPAGPVPIIAMSYLSMILSILN